MHDAQADFAVGTDDAKPRSFYDLDASVEFSLDPGNQAVHGNVQPETFRFCRHIVDLPVSDHENAGQPLLRYIGQTAIEIGKQCRAVICAACVFARRDQPAGFKIWYQCQPGAQFLAQARCQFVAPGDGLAFTAVNDNKHDTRQRVALLAAQGRINERSDQQGNGKGAHKDAAQPAPGSQHKQYRGQCAGSIKPGQGHKRGRVDNPVHGPLSHLLIAAF